MSLFTTTRGDPKNPAVVCLHGLMGSSRNLFRLTSHLASAGFFVVAYDQRGHGHSSHLPKGEGYTFQKFAEDLNEVLVSQNISKAHLVGHSLGARVSLTFCGMYPEKAASLCMLDAGVTIDHESLRELREILDPLPQEFESKAKASELLSHHDEAMKQFLLSNLRDIDGKMRWIVDLDGLRKTLLTSIQSDQTEIWKKLDIPVLIERGQLSKHFTQAELNRMLELNSKARAVLISGAAHWLHVDNFEDTVAAILKFLKEQKGE